MTAPSERGFTIEELIKRIANLPSETVKDVPYDKFRPLSPDNTPWRLIVKLSLVERDSLVSQFTSLEAENDTLEQMAVDHEIYLHQAGTEIAALRQKLEQAEKWRQEVLPDLNKFDAVVRVLGLEDTSDEPADEIRTFIDRLTAAQARIAALEGLLGEHNLLQTTVLGSAYKTSRLGSRSCAALQQPKTEGEGS